jgi:hypothetical protein
VGENDPESLRPGLTTRTVYIKGEIMQRKSYKHDKKGGVGNFVTGILVGGVVGATVGWLTAPASGIETRRRFRRGEMNARERVKTASGNIESRARELAEEVSH